jgi:hypothetical protein
MAHVAIPLDDRGLGLDLAEVVGACGDSHGEVEGGSFRRRRRRERLETCQRRHRGDRQLCMLRAV